MSEELHEKKTATVKREYQKTKVRSLDLIPDTVRNHGNLKA